MSLRGDRVRPHTAAEVLRRIDRETTDRLRHCADAGSEDSARRLEALDREWDTDRAIEAEASLMGLAGLALAALVRPAFLAIPAMAAVSVFTHALTGRYPLLPVFRRMGIRTAREIERERYALKALRGDFAGLGGTSPADTAAAPVPPAGIH